MCELLTIEELAATLKVKKSWIYGQTRRRAEDRIPQVRVGKYLRFKIDDVTAWLEKNRAEGAN